MPSTFTTGYRYAGLGYTTVFWSFAYADWDTDEQPDPTAAKNKILGQLHPDHSVDDDARGGEQLLDLAAHVGGIPRRAAPGQPGLAERVASGGASPAPESFSVIGASPRSVTSTGVRSSDRPPWRSTIFIPEMPRWLSSE